MKKNLLLNLSLSTKSNKELAGGFRLLKMVLVMALCFLRVEASAQSSGVSGVVVDEQNEPLIGATITVKGNNKIGTVTDADGKFSIPESQYKFKSTDVIVCDYIGMTQVEQVVGAQTYFTIIVSGDTTTQIDDVIVTGFQTIKKANFTGSSSKVAADDLKITGTSDVSRMLEGAVAGVSIQNVSGTFGSAPKVRVRGATSINGENKPLWVIDGIVQEDIISVSNDDLSSGDPTTLLGSAVAGISASDIESIDVLKDASATALYGARAMNGVIVVTTKRGQSGAPRVNYSGKYSVQLKPTYANYDIMNSSDQMSIYAELERKGWLNSDVTNWSNSGVYGIMYNKINSYDSATGTFALENTTSAKNEFLSYYANANTDWFDILFKNSLVQEHSLSISSGSEKSSSYASIGVLHDSGWSIADKVTRYTGNMRNDYKITDFISAGIQLTGSVRIQEAPGSLSRQSNTVEGTYDRDFDINPYSYCLNTSRALTAYDADGNLEYHTRNYAPFNIINELENNTIYLNVVDVKVAPELNIKITDKLRYEFKGAFRYAKSDMEHQITENSNMSEAYRADYTSTIANNNSFLYTDPDISNAEPVSVLPSGGFYNKTEYALLNYDLRNSFSYNNEWGKSALNAFAGQQIKFTNRQEYSSYGYGYQYDYGGVVATDYQIIKMMTEGGFSYFDMAEYRSRFAAFYASADYSYDRRYVVAATARYDGSNELGMNASSRWLPTWTVSGKWNVTNEKFMKNVEWIDELAARVSYGLTADMPSSASASAVYYAGSTSRPYTDEIETVIEISSLQNDDLTWEKSYLTNFGIDVGLFNRRLDIVLDYWVRDSFDLISTIKTSGVGGEMWKYANYADMESSGFDFMIGGYPIRTKNFSWHSNFNMGFTKTKITNADYAPSIYNLCKAEGGNKEGYPVNSLFSIQFVALDDNGVPTFIDESGEVAYDAYFQSTTVDYLKYEGSVDPTYTGGWSNTFSYKKLALNVFLTFQGGNKIRLNPIFSSTYSDLDAMPQVFYDRWVMSGDEQYTNVPSIIDVLLESELSGTYPFNAYNYSTERVADGDFVRLKNISLSYGLPERWSKAIGFRDVSVTCAASNIALLYADKKLNGQDPEYYNSGGVAQPVSTQITFALNVNF